MEGWMGKMKNLVVNQLFACLVVLSLAACQSPNSRLPLELEETPLPEDTAEVITPSDQIREEPVQETIPAISTERPAVQYDITYCAPDGVEQKLDLYYPEGEGPFPVVVHVHGGGWSEGDKQGGDGLGLFDELLSRGFIVASINYRLAPQYKFPAMIEDAKCAVRFLRANAQDLAVDGDHIGAYGGSAGGHLVSMLGTTDESAGFDTGEYSGTSSRVSAVLDLFGPIDIPGLTERNHLGSLPEQVFDASRVDEQTLQKASPLMYITPDDPPFLIYHGTRDNLVAVSQSELLLERLTEAGIPAELVIVEGAGHGFQPETDGMSPSQVELVQTAADFFEKYLK